MINEQKKTLNKLPYRASLRMPTVGIHWASWLAMAKGIILVDLLRQPMKMGSFTHYGLEPDDLESVWSGCRKCVWTAGKSLAQSSLGHRYLFAIHPTGSYCVPSSYCDRIALYTRYRTDSSPLILEERYTHSILSLVGCPAISINSQTLYFLKSRPNPT